MDPVSWTQFDQLQEQFNKEGPNSEFGYANNNVINILEKIASAPNGTGPMLAAKWISDNIMNADATPSEKATLLEAFAAALPGRVEAAGGNNKELGSRLTREVNTIMARMGLKHSTEQTPASDDGIASWMQGWRHVTDEAFQPAGAKDMDAVKHEAALQMGMKQDGLDHIPEHLRFVASIGLMGDVRRPTAGTKQASNPDDALLQRFKAAEEWRNQPW